MSSYDALAASYDALTVDVEYRRRADYLTRQFHRSALPVETVLDLACGTGTMACLLAERGYRMIAVDGSEEMLTQAAWKAAALEQPPMFLHQSMPRLHLGMEVDAAISTLDALNYLTRTADLRETLRRVYRWLRPGGLFLFDVNTPYKLRRMDGQVYLDETEDSYCVWRTFYAPGRKICTYQVDLFRLNANGSWDRAFEEHRERAWGREELETYLTEAGFGADLGAEKFLDIKCRLSGIEPSAVVVVATVRALKSHGGVAKPDLGKPNAEAVRAGSVNLTRHIENLQGFGLPVCVAINAFPTDTAEEMDVIYDVCNKAGVPCALSEVFAKGGEGGKALAETVLSILDDSAEVQYTYELDAPLTDKIEAVATKIYRAGRVSYTAAAKKTLDELTALGYGKLPVCIAKTQYSFSDNAKLTGAPEGHTLNVREVRLSAGAGFVVVVCGSIMTMPGLPKHPAAMDIDVDVHGKITGLF